MPKPSLNSKQKKVRSNSCRDWILVAFFTLFPLGIHTAPIERDGWLDLNKNGRKDVYEDPAAEVNRRVEDLLSQMTIEEKTCQLATLYGFRRVLKDELPTPGWDTEIWKDGIGNIDEHLNGVSDWREKTPINSNTWPASNHARALNTVQRWFLEKTRLGIPVDFTNEGIRGVCHWNSTNFPAELGIGATWNKDLAGQIGRVTGREAKALGYTNIYSPILDLARDPRWGRVVECYGEDPFLVTEMGVRQATGLMAEGVASTAKHFAIYSIPKGGRDGEARTDPHVSPREMETLYLRPFEDIIRRAGILGVMSSYNDYDGVPVSASHLLLTDYLRTRFGFRGYVVSDSNAVSYLWSKHRVATDYADACRQFLEAGGNVRTEFNSPANFILPVRELLKEGKLSPAVVDDRVRDVLRVKFALGLFDRPFVINPEAADAIVHSPTHQQLALQAARESIVLLKNQNDILPLSRKAGTLLVCGPNATEINVSQNRYGSFGGKVTSVLDGIKKIAGSKLQVKYEKGCDATYASWPTSELLPQPPDTETAASIQRATQAAATADVVVVVLGDSSDTVGESKTRTSLELPGYQNALVDALIAKGKPIVAVLMNGRPASINRIQQDVPSVLEAWFPGETGGQAVAEVIFGDYNPGGKLPVTFPKTVGQLEFNFPAKPASQAGMGKKPDPNDMGNTMAEGPLYPFGFGLSYTTFSYTNLEIAPRKFDAGGQTQISCSVKNTGNRDGDTVVQLYLRDVLSSVITYEKVLRGFERVHLQAGESKRIAFSLTSRDMELLNQQSQWVVEPGVFEVEIGSSSVETALSGSFEVTKASGK